MSTKPGRNLSSAEKQRLRALIAQQYPDEQVDIYFEDEVDPDGVRSAEYYDLHLEQAGPDGTRKPVRSARDANIIQKILVAVLTLVAGLYLANPGGGLVELIPDLVPIVGNLDEATALTLLISGFSFFGFNVGWLTNIFGRRGSGEERPR